MLTKTRIVLAAVLLAGSASGALAQEFDGNLANRYPGYAGAGIAATQGFQSAPVRLQEGRSSFRAPTRGAGHLPGAFGYQQQPEYPQSPPGGGY